ncbi:hypothetical protein PM082_015876 [Marasmius tenuissimus]|nr:hypothetical protein PM082_015876 [Marasmius tenuissimus]
MGERVPGSRSIPLKQIAFWRFDDEGLLNKYDAWIPDIPLWINTSNGIDFTNPLVQPGVPSTLCPVIQQNCEVRATTNITRMGWTVSPG